ncbi:hypothetical protein NUU61_008087 [Penicillium alfredii]|uniref:Developmental regulatory protein wetA n=1 Tax=Penicillium alfredii TaxID=1506179 RepID=A0A9W9ERZ5_9EURO|nr:uncharacterized protein NUU61_008087 [Penicillium alfredii]KAJ5086780.1 hypothetical protein NUU61_008087 [Penicillium alfredii]
MFAQPFDHSFNDIFNQYVNMDSSGPDGNKDPSFSGDLDQLFPLDALSSDCGDLSPIVSTSKPRQSPQPWQEDEASTNQLAFHDTVHPSVISDLGLNNFECSSRAPNGATKSAIVTPKSIRHRDPNERLAFLRKQSFSPTFKRSANLQKGKMAYPEAWAQRIQHFNLHGSEDRLPLSPPPSDVLVQQENMTANHTMHQHRDSAEMPPQYDARLFHQSPAMSMPSPSTGTIAQHQQPYLSHPSSSNLTNSSPPSADDIFSSSHSSNPQSISSWQSDALGTSSLSFTPDLQGHDAQAWWSPMPSRVAQPQTPYQSIVTSPTPQRSMSNVGTQNDVMQGGLMIQFDPSFDMSADSSFSSSNMLPANSQKFMAPFATPQVQHSSRSPSLSPKAGTSPRDARNGVASKANHRRTHSRKLSAPGSTGPKPAKSSGSPRGSNKSVNVSFVNFTADDSKRILTGVAPSGSSKTKARREQEARDRRRKLSEAALKAVRTAGGDVDALEAVLC